MSTAWCNVLTQTLPMQPSGGCAKMAISKKKRKEREGSGKSTGGSNP